MNILVILLSIRFTEILVASEETFDLRKVQCLELEVLYCPKGNTLMLYPSLRPPVVGAVD